MSCQLDDLSCGFLTGPLETGIPISQVFDVKILHKNIFVLELMNSAVVPYSSLPRQTLARRYLENKLWTEVCK